MESEHSYAIPRYVESTSKREDKQGYVETLSLRDDKEGAKETMRREYAAAIALLRRSEGLARALGVWDGLEKVAITYLTNHAGEEEH